MINFIMGITCSGKDELVQYALKQFPDRVGVIQVGKEMRKRHPPEYFRGLGALEETEPETWQIFDEQFSLIIGKQQIFVTGMPRLKGQIAKFFQRLEPEKCRFYLLTCCESYIYERLQKRFENQPTWASLAQQRIQNDKLQLFDVLIEVGLTHRINILQNETFFQRDMNAAHIMRQ